MYHAPPPTTATGRTCPVCGRQAMSLFTRLTWKTHRAVTCQSCGVPLRLTLAPWLTALWLAFLPLPIAMAAVPGARAAIVSNLIIVIPLIQSIGAAFIWLGYRYGQIRAR